MRPHLLIFLFIITLWSLSLYFYNNPALMDSLGWLKAAVSLTIIVVFSLFCFIILASNKSFRKFKIPLAIATMLSLVIILALFIDYPLSIKTYLINLSPQANVFLLFLFIYIGLGVAILFERAFPGSTSDRLRVNYTLIAFAVFVIVTTIIYLFVPLVRGLGEYLWLGPLFTAIFPLFFIFGYYLIKKSGKESKREKEAERLTQEWEKLNRAKEQFLLSLQHHLRTPLTPFKIYLERILDGTYGREENPVIKEKLIEMKQLANTLYSMIESLLDIQALRLGKEVLNLEDCQVDNLIKSVIEELKPQAEQKGLYLVFESAEPSTTADRKIPTMKIDKKRVREALWNLIDNAIKYTRKGGVAVKLKIENLKLKIIVSDTGIGMTKEEIADFLRGELFKRGEEAKKLYGPGRGIGLTIATEFIKAQGGRIWAESEDQGKGTTFWIELPVKR